MEIQEEKGTKERTLQLCRGERENEGMEGRGYVCMMREGRKEGRKEKKTKVRERQSRQRILRSIEERKGR